MTLVWAAIAIAALIGVGFVLGRYVARQRLRYIYSAAWAEEHWREQHERARAHRHPED